MMHQPPYADNKQLLPTFAALTGRIGIFGGTFDPVHNAHLELARQAMRHHKLDLVIFIPAGENPLKESPPVASDAQRIQMLLLAIHDEPRFFVSPFETERGGKSFTVDTLEEVRRQAAPSAELFLLAGADCFETLPRWKNHKRIFELARVALVPRNGLTAAMFEMPSALSLKELENLRANFVPMAEMPLNASAMREAAEHIAPASVPALVMEFIRAENLYSS